MFYIIIGNKYQTQRIVMFIMQNQPYYECVFYCLLRLIDKSLCFF